MTKAFVRGFNDAMTKLAETFPRLKKVSPEITDSDRSFNEEVERRNGNIEQLESAGIDFRNHPGISQLKPFYMDRAIYNHPTLKYKSSVIPFIDGTSEDVFGGQKYNDYIASLLRKQNGL